MVKRSAAMSFVLVCHPNIPRCVIVLTQKWWPGTGLTVAELYLIFFLTTDRP